VEVKENVCRPAEKGSRLLGDHVAADEKHQASTPVSI
jgi:hypothetical protein